MELRRHKAIKAIISTCHNWIEKLRDTYECPMRDDYSYACGSILLGAFTKEMHRLGYLSPKLEIPFAGQSFESICKNVKEIKSPQWCHPASHYSRWHDCNLQSTLSPDVDAIMANTQGLHLHDFKDRAKELN